MIGLNKPSDSKKNNFIHQQKPKSFQKENVYTSNISVRLSDMDVNEEIFNSSILSFVEQNLSDYIESLGFSRLAINPLKASVFHNENSYIQPIKHPNTLTIKANIVEVLKNKVIFYFEVFNQERILCSASTITVIFIDKKNGSVCPVPGAITQI